jgi:hypothetical protein
MKQNTVLLIIGISFAIWFALLMIAPTGGFVLFITITLSLIVIISTIIHIESPYSY